MLKRNRGFTLVEMLIVIAIIGILAGIGYPSYISQVLKANRADAKIALNDVAQRMQRCFTSASTYKPATTGICTVVDSVTATAGITSTEGFYTVKLATADHAVSTYILRAKPVTGKRQSKDTKCAEFSLDQTGKKLAKDSSGNDTTSTCW